MISSSTAHTQSHVGGQEIEAIREALHPNDLATDWASGLATPAAHPTIDGRSGDGCDAAELGSGLPH